MEVLRCWTIGFFFASLAATPVCFFKLCPMFFVPRFRVFFVPPVCFLIYAPFFAPCFLPCFPPQFMPHVFCPRFFSFQFLPHFYTVLWSGRGRQNSGTGFGLWFILCIAIFSPRYQKERSGPDRSEAFRTGFASFFPLCFVLFVATLRKG